MKQTVAIVCLLGGIVGQAAEPASAVERALAQEIIGPALSLEEVRVFNETRVPDMPRVSTAAEWQAKDSEYRRNILDKVVFRGEAAKWRDTPLRVEWSDTIEGLPGYRIRKLRFEAVTGWWIPALLYEPTKLSGKRPVVLNVNGHDGKGKAADYKQLRCINQAKRGMIALNVEWIGMGQFASRMSHYQMNQMDLCGTAGIAPFFLNMSKGLDILLAHPNADPTRVAVAGLSGGGWQTIFISSLDERVTLANPVAGYSSFKTRARHGMDLGDSEQTPNDLALYADYTHLTAMLANRAALLTNNAYDKCCFTAGHALPPLIAAAAPLIADAAGRVAKGNAAKRLVERAPDHLADAIAPSMGFKEKQCGHDAKIPVIETHAHGNLLLRLYGQARGRGAEYWGKDFLNSDKWMWINGVPQRSEIGRAHV